MESSEAKSYPIVGLELFTDFHIFTIPKIASLDLQQPSKDQSYPITTTH